MSMTVIEMQREFMARRLAHERMIRAGDRVRACGAARLAAKLYMSGVSPGVAAQRAAKQVAGQATVGPFGGYA